MKIIITGATGFIGRNLAEGFHKEGMDVIAIGRSEYVGKALREIGIEFKLAKIEDLPQLEKAFFPADYVIHCAGRAGDWWKYQDFFERNVIGTRNLIDACKKNGNKKIIFMSTSTVYLSGKDRFNVIETEPLPKRQFSYGKTKLMAEEELLGLANDGFKTIIFRPRAVYGKYDQNIVARFLRLSEQENLPLINRGQALIDITYIDNLASAVKNCFSAPDDAWNEVYNISNGSPVTLMEWISQVLEIFERPFKPKNIPESAAKRIAFMNEMLSVLPFGNKRPELTRFSVEYMGKSMTLSIEKAKKKLNYVPAISNQEGFKKLSKWYLESKL